MICCIVEHQAAVAHGTVGQNFQVGLGAFHGAQIAAVLLDLILQAGPGRELVGHANLFDAGRSTTRILKCFECSGAGFDVILDALRQAGEKKLKTGASRLRLHGDLFPFGGALIARVEAHVVGLQADELRRDQLIGIAANRGVAGSDANVVERAGRRARHRSTAAQRRSRDSRARRASARPSTASEASPIAERRQQRRVGNELFRFAARAISSVSAASNSMNGSRFAASRSAKVTRRCLNCGKASSALPAARRGLSPYSGRAKPKPIAKASDEQQDNARAGQRPRREGEVIGDQDEDDRGGQRDRGEDGGAAQHGAETQASLQLLDIGVELVPSAHGSSRGMVRYWLAKQGFGNGRQQQ